MDLRAPLDGAVYLFGQEVLADYDCADEALGSGLASCAGDVADGAPLDTSSVGAKTFAVEASDAAGNVGSAASAYRVVYDFRGFLWPVRDRPAVNRARAGRIALVRFSLNGFHGRRVLAAGYPRVAEMECGSGAEPADGEPARLLGPPARRALEPARPCLHPGLEDEALVGRKLPPAAARIGRRNGAPSRLSLQALAPDARVSRL